MKTYQKILAFGIVLLLVVTLVWGTYTIAKHLSYRFFYKEMVKQTITEMVKKEALK